jgi:hypothetical protein
MIEIVFLTGFLVGLASLRSGVLPPLADRPPLRSVAHVLNTVREQEIAASVGAHRDLGGGYDDAIASGLVERIGAEVDRRVDERISLYQGVGQSSADGAGVRDARHRPAAHPGSPVSWQQTILAFGSMVIGAITSGVILGHEEGAWPILVIWFAIVVINMAVLRAGPFRPGRRFPG